MKSILPQLTGEPYALARARALLTVYAETWAARWNEYRVLDVEKEFRFPLYNPETKGRSQSFDEAGKIDALLKHTPTGQVVVLEHKTTSDSVDPASDYWDRLRMDTQCSKYYLSQLHEGKNVECVLYDVIRKPLQRPCFVVDRDVDGFKIVVDRAGNRVFTANGKKPRETADPEKDWEYKGHTETPAEYEARLLDILRTEPHAYYAQREVPRLERDLHEYMRDAWAMGQQLLYARTHKLWPRNPQACKQMGTCEMFDLCCGRASVDGIRYQYQAIHAELTMQTGEGDRQLLTASRMAAYRKCPRYHQLRYEEGVRAVAEEADALTFGTLIHKGLELYFKSKQTTERK